MWEIDRPDFISRNKANKISSSISDSLASLDLSEREWKQSFFLECEVIRITPFYERGVFKEPLLLFLVGVYPGSTRGARSCLDDFIIIKKMPFSYVANCLFITYGPLAAIYSATGVKQGVTHFLGLPMRVLTIFFVSQVLKVCLYPHSRWYF